MDLDFEIGEVVEIKGQVYMFGRLLDEGNFVLSEGSSLGGVEIEQWTEQPRVLDERSQQRKDVFAFVLKKGEDRTKLHKGKTVVLRP